MREFERHCTGENPASCFSVADRGQATLRKRGEAVKKPSTSSASTNFPRYYANGPRSVIGRKTIKERMPKQLQAVKMGTRRPVHHPDPPRPGRGRNQTSKGYLNVPRRFWKTARAWWWYFNQVRWRRGIKPLKRRSQWP